MAKKKQFSTAVSEKGTATSSTPFWNSNRFYQVILVLAVLFLYMRTTSFEFTLDDDLFYLKHASVQKGWDGMSEFFSYGSLNKFDGTTGVQPYRPLTLLYFAFQKEFFDNSAAAAHFFNVLFYVLLALLIFSLLKKLFPHLPRYVTGGLALLFVVHPLHTEVVCSVKSVDELLAALFGFGAWSMSVGIWKDNKLQIGKWLATAMLLFLALLSKESAIAFLAIIPLSAWLIEKVSMRQAIVQFVPMMVVASLFLLLRHTVIGTEKASTGIPELENILNAASGFAELTATKAEILFHYLRLILVPWPLNWDYSYNQIPLVGWTSFLAIAGLLLHLLLLLAAIYYFKRKPVVSFSILFYFIASAPVNNVFFINGATLGERLMFVPSFGIIMLIVLKWWERVREKENAAAKSAFFFWPLMAIAALFFGLSASRSGDWKNNFTLFAKGVERSPNSSRAHYSLASEYLKMADLAETNEDRRQYFSLSAEHMEKSISIFPKNFQAHYNGGICYAKMGDTAKAIQHYRAAVLIDPKYVTAINNLGVIYQAIGNYDSAKILYEKAYALYPNDRIPRKNLGDLYFIQGIEFSKTGNLDKTLQYYRKSMEFTPDNIFLLNNMASLFSGRAQYDSALAYLQKGLQVDSNSLMILENLAAVSYLSKRYDQAIEAATKALNIKKGSKKSLGVLADTYRALGKTVEADNYLQLYKYATP